MMLVTVALVKITYKKSLIKLLRFIDKYNVNAANCLNFLNNKLIKFMMKLSGIGAAARGHKVAFCRAFAEQQS